MKTYRNLAQVFEDSFATKADKIAIEDRCRVEQEEGQEGSVYCTKYGQLEKRVAALSHAFREQFELKCDDVVAIISPNRTEFIETYIASLFSGCVAVGVPHMFAMQEIATLLDHLEPRLIVVDDRYIEKVVGAYEKTIHKKGLPILVMDRVDKGKRLHEIYAHCFSYESIISVKGVPSRLNFDTEEMQEFSPSRTAILVMTSGTTGLPKAAITSHKQLINSVVELFNSQNNEQVPTIPLYNSMAWIGGVLMQNTTLSSGGKIILFDGYNRDTVLPHFATSSITLVVAMPLVLSDMCEKAEKDKEWLKGVKQSVQAVIYGGGHTSLTLQKKATSLFMPEVSIVQEYMQTEAHNITKLLPMDHFSNPTPKQAKVMKTVGVILRPEDVRIAKENGELCPVDEVGEVQVRADNRYTTRGYYRAPEKTAELYVDGWLRTGDLGSIDANNYLTLSGRSKDMIVTSEGYNVFAKEVEDILAQHPAVAEVAVAAVSSVDTGTAEAFEYVGAFVVLQDKEVGQKKVNESDIISFCVARLAPFKVPRYVSFVEALPRNRNYKVVKSDLVRKFQAARSA